MLATKFCVSISGVTGSLSVTSVVSRQHGMTLVGPRGGSLLPPVCHKMVPFIPESRSGLQEGLE